MEKETYIKDSFLKTDEHTQASGPVMCLGLTFASDAERRAYFTEELRKKLPDLKKIEGYPIGKDEDILALSDPPYYTACPNPWISDFIAEWEINKPDKPAGYQYHREPFAADVSEGKNDPIYNAHSYHTKVPYKAIMRYILHYTDPGDIVVDGFCGTGMTGVAAQMCGDRVIVQALGYKVAQDGTILKEEVDAEGETSWIPFSKLGARRAILNDLSPAATFISYNYNTPVNVAEFEIEIKQILEEVKSEYGWMYETKHSNGKNGKINYIVWSDVFVCPYCAHEVVFWNAAIDEKASSIKEEFACPHCKATLTKRKMDRSWLSKFDTALQEIIRQEKQVPVLINYTIGKKRYEKVPDTNDLLLIDRIEQTEMSHWFPKDRMMIGKETRRNDPSGITHVHHFYTKRNLLILELMYKRINEIKLPHIRRAVFSIFNSVQQRHCKMNSFRFNVSVPSNIRSGTLYISSLTKENNFFDQFENKSLRRLKPVYEQIKNFEHIVVQSASAETLIVDDNSIDYVFIDPPFGANLNYSELNSLWEYWLKVRTNNKEEAIENEVQGKGETEYRNIMTKCFREVYRILKPSSWMTVEFSNTKASIWNSIQSSIAEAGFVVANVSALDKGGNSIMALTTPTAVKQDLVISAYKPADEMMATFFNNKYSEESAWSFVRNHLEQLPVFVGQKQTSELIVERTSRVLFDRMVSYYVQNGLSVPISSADFQEGIAQRFPMRDGMVFLETQVVEYDKKRLFAKNFAESSLFVSDENSAIEWLRQQFLKKPQARQDIQPGYMKEIQHISKHELLPELDVLLEQNFLQYDGNGPVPSQIHSYLSTNFKDMRELDKEDISLRKKAKDRWYVPDPNKQADLEKLREKSLLREFGAYVEEINRSKKKLKQFRLEAIRAGFKKAWGEKDYKTIVDIGSKLPDAVLQEDDKLLMYYDNAQIRLDM